MRGYGKAGVVDAIRAAGGEVYAITSEPHSLARSAQEDWGTGFEHVGDPHQEILAVCRERDWLSLFTNDWSGGLVDRLSWVSHPKGYFQPGVLALSERGRVLYRWRCRPTRSNIGGAVARPRPDHVWERVQAALGEAPDAPDAAHDDDAKLDAGAAPWPLFVLLLLANGWFLKPAVFDQRSEGASAEARIRQALMRTAVFLVAWVAAFALLPTWIPALALALWIAKVWPGVRTVHRQFQNVGANEEPT